MFLRTSTWKSTKTCSNNIERLKNELETADAIVIGAGAGLTTSAGMRYDGERFEKYFSDFHRKYGMPIFFSFLPKVKPGVPFSTTKAEMPLVLWLGSVTALVK